MQVLERYSQRRRLFCLLLFIIHAIKNNDCFLNAIKNNDCSLKLPLILLVQEPPLLLLTEEQLLSFLWAGDQSVLARTMEASKSHLKAAQQVCKKP